MSYEVFKPCGGRFGIPRGQLSLSARGMGRFNVKDLEAVGIEDRATLLIDRERRSIALRASIEAEQGVIVGTENGDLARTVWLAGALRAVGLNPAELHGWHGCAAAEDRLEIRWQASKSKVVRK